MRKICVFTGTRADYGLLYPLLKKLQADPQIELEILISGTHLSPLHGKTIEQIEKDGFKSHLIADIELKDNSNLGVMKSFSLGVDLYGKNLAKIKPDIAVVLGDRYEALAFALCASFLKIPLGHIHGGELTFGAMDDAFRHSISKLSYWHFVTAEDYAKRVIQLGEDPKRVFNVGSLGIENVLNLPLMAKNELAQKFSFEFRRNNVLFTLHPETLSSIPVQEQVKITLKALENLDSQSTSIFITLPNADTDGEVMIREIKNWAQGKSHVYVQASLGQAGYLSLISQVNVVVGNSSSGVIEVPSFKVPTVNIGNRQKGRMQADSILNCDFNQVAIQVQIETALKKHQEGAYQKMQNPLKGEDVSGKILRILKTSPIPENLQKDFYPA
jgi:UDP-hydrolysing UDP-N-acetyl-D-glucosamine 2-epimerase